MPKFAFRKLIRDNILDKHIEAGHKIDHTVLSDNELKTALRKKLHEEADEIPIRDNPDDEIIEEIADVQQVIDDLKLSYGITSDDVRLAQEHKFKMKGGFNGGVYIESVTADESDEWVTYYRSNPEKYIEILESDENFTIPSIDPGIYQHYKGNKYRVLGVGCNTETNEFMVMYESLYEKQNVPKFWLRPYDMFIETVIVADKEIPRFKKISE